MTEADLESALARHYLRADGPFGAGPLKYIDATPEQICLAFGRPTADVNVLHAEFLSFFTNRAIVLQALSDGHPIAISKAEGPGWFRYLVLCCVVAAASAELAAEGDYRERLRTLLGWSSGAVGLAGTADLWRRLATWCDAARARGEPYRRIILPDPGWMKQIGYSQRITFPSRRDKERLSALVGEHESSFATPRGVIGNIRRHLNDLLWSEAFREVFLDFEDRYHRGDRLIAEHAFWRLLTEIQSEIRSCSRNVAPYLRMLVDVDQDTLLEIRVTCESVLSDSRRASTESDDFALTGSIDEVLHAIILEADRKVDGLVELSRHIHKGVLTFAEEGWGDWIWRANPYGGSVRLLATGIVCNHSLPKLSWRKVSTDWYLSEVIEVALLEEMLGATRSTAQSAERVRKLVIEGGIRTPAGFLGRVGLLPLIRTAAGASIVLKEVRVECGELEMDQTHHEMVTFSSTSRVAGSWQISAIESSAAPSAELRLSFVDRAVEHEVIALPDTSNWLPESELLARERVALHVARVSTLGGAGEKNVLMDNLLEAVYAGGRSGWSEIELLSLMRQVFGPDGPNQWDLLRSLSEGGWLTARVAARWRVRRWYLRPARLLDLTGAVLLDGAACETLRERFTHVVSRLGGSVELRSGVSPWAVPLVVAWSIDVQILAAELNLPIAVPECFSFSPAPLCWLKSIYDKDHRQLAQVWDWRKGRFGPPAELSGARLERWSRANGDARDVFRLVQGSGRSLLFDSRVAAILEAHRHFRRPLYCYHRNLLFRATGEGWLPSEVAIRLRLRHLRAPGPIQLPAGNLGYGYPADEGDVTWLARQFGSAVTFNENNFVALSQVLARRQARLSRIVRAGSAYGDPI